MITSLSAAGGAMAGVVAALGYRCTYVCVKNMMYAMNYLCKMANKDFEKKKKKKIKVITCPCTDPN